MKENLKAQFEAIINEQSGEAILNKFYRKDVIKAMQRAYDMALQDKEKLESKLFSAFVKSLTDSGGYTIPQLKLKEPELMAEVFQYWVDNLQEYDLAQPPVTL